MHTSIRQIKLCLVILVFVTLTGCAGLISQVPWNLKSDDSLKERTNLNYAIKEAEKLQEYFYDAANNQAFLPRRIGALTIPAAVAMLGLASADVINASDVALGGIAAGGLYTYGTFLTNNAHVAIYEIGARALECSISKSSRIVPLANALDVLREKRDAFREIRDQVRAINGLRSDRRLELESALTQTLAPFDNAVAEGDKMTGPTAGDLASARRTIQLQVSTALRANQVTLSDLKSLLEKLMTEADSVLKSHTPGSGEGFIDGKSADMMRTFQSTFRDANPFWALQDDFGDLVADGYNKYNDLQTAAKNFVTELEILDNIETESPLKSCLDTLIDELGDIVPIVLSPNNERFDVVQGGQVKFEITGGKPENGAATHQIVGVATPPGSNAITPEKTTVGLTTYVVINIPNDQKTGTYVFAISAAGAKARKLTVEVAAGVPVPAPIPQTVKLGLADAKTILAAFKALANGPKTTAKAVADDGTIKEDNITTTMQPYIHELQAAAGFHPTNDPRDIDGAYGIETEKVFKAQGANGALTTDIVSKVLALKTDQQDGLTAYEKSVEADSGLLGHLVAGVGGSAGDKIATLADKIKAKRVALGLPEITRVTPLLMLELTP